MNKKYKLLALILCAVCIITACVCLSACDEDTPPVPDYFDVTVNAQEGGQCQLSAPHDGVGYAKDENVTITIVEDEGYSVESVTVNNQAVELVDNKYTFAITQDTEITAVFAYCANIVNEEAKGVVSISAPKNGHSFVRGEQATVNVTANTHFTIVDVVVDGKSIQPKNGTYQFIVGENRPEIVITYIGDAIPQSVLDSLCGDIKFSGEYFYDITEGDDVHSTIETVFNERAVRQIEINVDSGEVQYDSYIIKSNEDPRAIAFVIRTINNEVLEKTDTSHYFSDYDNQFDLFSVNDFEYVSEGVYSLYDSAKAKRASSAITGWNESIAKFYIYVENGIAVKAEIVTEVIDIANTDESYVSTYTFNISEHGTAVVEPILPYERNEHHDALEQALQNAQLATWYTVNHFGHEVGYVPPEDGEDRPGYGDNNYYVYITEDMVYDSFPTEEHGFKVLNGYIYPFTYERDVEKVVITDPINIASIEELQASFEGFSVELFKYVGDGKYVLQDNTLACEIVGRFGEGYEKNYYVYATNLAITLKDGVLHTIEFTYKTYGITEEVRLTYDFETPIDVNLDFENVTKESVIDPFKGTYLDTEGNYIVVDSYGFTINGIEAKIYSYNKEEGIFTLQWDGKVLYAQKLSTKQIIIASEDSSLYIIATMLGDQIVNIPAEMKGVWFISTDDEQGHVEYKFEIQSHVVKLDGKAINVLSYTDAEGLVCEDENGTYSMYVKEFEDGIGLVLLHVLPDGNYLSCVLDLTQEEIGIEIPLEFVGTYIYFDGITSQKVEITPSTITVMGEEFIPTSYNAEQQMFVGTLGSNTKFTLGFGMSTDWLIVGPQNLSFERTEVILPTYIGTWQSTVDPNDPDDKQYIVVIDETSICINGTYVEFVKDEYGYSFEMPGSAFTTHIIYSSSSTSGKVTLWMYDNNILLKSLSKVGEGGDTKWPATYIGTWNGTDSNGVQYTFTITEDSVSIKVGDAEAIVCEDAVYDMDAIVFTYDGKECIFGVMDGNGYAYCTEAGWSVAKLIKAE